MRPEGQVCARILEEDVIIYHSLGVVRIYEVNKKKVPPLFREFRQRREPVILFDKGVARKELKITGIHIIRHHSNSPTYILFILKPTCTPDLASPINAYTLC